MTKKTISYDVLTQKALRGVVRSVLVGVAKSGLPGDHHFYIAFDTCAKGVKMSDKLKEQYPEEMTVVLQYQFWDLEVGEDNFGIKLSFNNLPESLVIPYEAIRAFFDPSVRFGLQFSAPGAANDESSQTSAVPVIVKQYDGTDQPVMPDPADEQVIKRAIEDAETEPEELPEPEDEDTERPVAEVVELDAFRKK